MIKVVWFTSELKSHRLTEVRRSQVVRFMSRSKGDWLMAEVKVFWFTSRSKGHAWAGGKGEGHLVCASRPKGHRLMVYAKVKRSRADGKTDIEGVDVT